MFLENSRYYRVPQVEVKTADRTVKAVRLRRLPPVGAGQPHIVQDGDRLDILAHRQYGDATGFWRIADANSEQAANRLVDTPLREIQI